MNNNNVNMNKYSYYQVEDNKLSLDTIILPNINKNSYITDTRKLQHFKTQTFGGYSKSQISSALDKCIIDGKIETAVQYGIQLFFSGIVNNLLDKLIIFSSKNINISNPKLPEFLYNRMLKWHKITDNSKFTKESVFLLRNHPEMRNLVVEIIVILCLAKKRKLETGKKIKKTDFIIENFKKNLEAPNTNLIDKIAKREDPSEMKIAINELGYHILKGNINFVYFWINWVLEWDKSNTKKYGKYDCSYRTIKGVDSKYCRNVIWLIWDMVNLTKNIKMKNYEIGYKNKINNQIGYLWNLFIYKYSTAQRNKKIPLLIWSINYIINFIDWKIPLIDRPYILFQSLLNNDRLIRNLKVQSVNKGLVNTSLMNIVVENNYMIPEKHKQYAADFKKKENIKKQKELIKFKKMKEQEAKRKKTNVETLDKLKILNNIDKQIF